MVPRDTCVPYALGTGNLFSAIILVRHGHVFVVFVPCVEDFETDATIVLEAIGEVDSLDVVLDVVLGAVPEGVANGAEPGGRPLALHPAHVIIEAIQPGTFKHKWEKYIR